ncbi:TRAP transporter small permease [Chachezhania sediminis]|uniref:TRAP transporter small permease n=1 Tax=Chachezhania sediminis TaxID=2599291 RepID=UPI00131D92F6|nr:TRAP transporter small permease [Chachezhania sediminis]
MSQGTTGVGHRASALRRTFRLITAVLTGVLLLALTGVTLVDVVGRYFFSRPLSGASEMTELLVMAVVFTGLPAICLDDGHITVDLFTAKLKGTAETVQVMLARLVVVVMLGLISWQLWEHGARIGAWGETTVYLRFPLAPVARAASVLCALSAAIVLMLAVLRLPKGKSGDI